MSTQLLEKPKPTISDPISGILAGTEIEQMAPPQPYLAATTGMLVDEYYKSGRFPFEGDSVDMATVAPGQPGMHAFKMLVSSGESVAAPPRIEQTQQRKEIMDALSQIQRRIEKQTPLTVKSAPFTVFLTHRTKPLGPAHEALIRAGQLRRWFGLTWKELGDGLGINEGTFFNWQKHPETNPRSATLDRLDSFWGFANAVRGQVKDDEFRSWCVRPFEGATTPKDAIKDGDLNAFRRATRPIVRPRKPRNRRPQSFGVGAWSPELDD